MSQDWTVIGLLEPTQPRIVEALVAAVPHLSLRQTAGNTLLEIVDDADTVLLALELPRLIQVPEEALRLLAGAPVSAPASAVVPALFAPGGSGRPEDPLWWQDIHALGPQPGSGELADRLCHALAALCTGVVIAPFGEAGNE